MSLRVPADYSDQAPELKTKMNPSRTGARKIKKHDPGTKGGSGGNATLKLKDNSDSPALSNPDPCDFEALLCHLLHYLSVKHPQGLCSDLFPSANFTGCSIHPPKKLQLQMAYYYIE